MKTASGPLIGRPAAFNCRITPTPASKRKTRFPTTTAVAGPAPLGSGYGVPVPSSTTFVSLVPGLFVACAATSRTAKQPTRQRIVNRAITDPFALSTPINWQVGKVGVAPAYDHETN